MKPARLEAYWGLMNGHREMMSDMPASTYGVVFQQLKEGSVHGQYTLPFEGASDIQLVHPAKEHERTIAEEARIEKVRQEIRTMVRIPSIERKIA